MTGRCGTGSAGGRSSSSTTSAPEVRSTIAVNAAFVGAKTVMSTSGDERAAATESGPFGVSAVPCGMAEAAPTVLSSELKPASSAVPPTR